MYIQRQVGEGERRAVSFQESSKEGVVVSFTRPGLEGQEVGVVVGARSENVCACLSGAFRAVGAESLDVREAFPSIGVVFSNGGMSSKGSGDPSKFLRGVVGHVKEVMIGCLVFDGGPERLPVTSYVEPVSPAIGREAGECLPLFVGFGHVPVEEVLP